MEKHFDIYGHSERLHELQLMLVNNSENIQASKG